MALREVPRWAMWLITLGLIMPLVGFVNLKTYTPSHGFFWNLVNQDVELPLFKGPNPVSCISKAINELVSGSLFGPDSTTYACYSPIYVDYLTWTLVSIFILLLGLYFQLRGIEMVNIWPTEWTPLKPENVLKTGDSAIPDVHKKLDSSESASENTHH